MTIVWLHNRLYTRNLLFAEPTPAEIECGLDDGIISGYNGQSTLLDLPSGVRV